MREGVKNNEAQINETQAATAEQGPLTEPATVPGENEAIIKLKEENAKLNDQVLRIAADAENIRRRLAREAEEAGKYAITKFARELIDVLENLYRAESSIQSSEELESSATLKALFSGVELTKKSLADAFEKNGIKRIDPVIGDKFDHTYHQAMAQVPATTHESDSVVQVIQAGYIIHDRLLRPALVVIAK